MTLFAQPQQPSLRPEPFIRKWLGVQFGEKQAAQEMFLDLCRLVGHPTPGEYGNPEAFTFEKWVPGGFADAYLEERFGWEFKGSDADLDAAMQQLLRYQVHLKTPPPVDCLLFPLDPDPDPIFGDGDDAARPRPARPGPTGKVATAPQRLFCPGRFAPRPVGGRKSPGKPPTCSGILWPIWSSATRIRNAWPAI